MAKIRRAGALDPASAKLIRTYPLFPGMRLVKGVARINALSPLGKRAALDLFHELETLAGVPVIEGRGWYGVRRISSDIAEDIQKDGRVLNAITGHTSDETRRKVYQQKIRNIVLALASETRHATRDVAIEAAAASASHNGSITPVLTGSRWEQKRAEKQARRRAAHGPNKSLERRAAAYASKRCEKCGTEFVPEGANTRACSSCSPRRGRPAKASTPTPEPTPA